MSGFGLGSLEWDEDVTDADNPDFDWTPNEGDLEGDPNAPPPPVDDVREETPTTAPGTNLINKSSFENPGSLWPWSGWTDVPYAWERNAYHGVNVARVVPEGSRRVLHSSQRIPVDPAKTYWCSGYGWMDRYTSGSARLLLEERDAYDNVLNTHVVGEWNTPTSWYATVVALAPSSFYRLGEDSGDYADTMGFADGAVAGTHTRNVPGVVPASPNGALRLPGWAGSNVNLGDVYGFVGNTDFSVAGWVKSEDFSGSMRVIGKVSTSSPDSGWYVSVENGEYAKFVRYNNDDGFTEYEVRNTPEGGFLTGRWYFICATWDGLEGTLYVNGVDTAEAATGDDDVVLLNSAESTRIGVSWDGDLDEFAIWRFSLTGPEVKSLYEARLAQWSVRSVRFRQRSLTATDVAWDPDTSTVSIKADTSGNPVFDFRLDGLFFALGEQEPTGVFDDSADAVDAITDHDGLTGVTADQHHAQAHTITGSDHTMSGLTPGHVLTAQTATSAAFAAPAGGGDSYTHNQGVADTTWTVTHNLGRYPAVTALDSAGSEFECSVAHDSTNQCTLTLSYATSGTATCS